MANQIWQAIGIYILSARAKREARLIHQSLPNLGSLVTLAGALKLALERIATGIVPELVGLMLFGTLPRFDVHKPRRQDCDNVWLRRNILHPLILRYSRSYPSTGYL